MSGSEQQKLGQNIRDLREKRGLTLEKLAAEVELDASFLAYIERGEKNVSSDKLIRIAKSLGVEVAFIKPS